MRAGTRVGARQAPGGSGRLDVCVRVCMYKYKYVCVCIYIYALYACMHGLGYCI